nr:uncharacterized protein LOC113818127 isoform X1 [Penaeus vannamei]XP_027226084.1 uncharacterized protein LOC113818127 isoform X1 [Penaeus vannamei]
MANIMSSNDGKMCAVTMANITSNDGQEAGPAAAAETSGVLRGEISCVVDSVGILKKVDGYCRVFFAHQCFLYGVCLRDVRLEDVLHEGKMVSYKLSDDGWKVKSVLIGSNHCTKTLDPKDLFYVLKAWCHSNCIPQDTTDILLNLAGWIPDDLNPTIDQKDYKEVVDADSLPGP